jgi:hypothetical protein
MGTGFFSEINRRLNASGDAIVDVIGIARSTTDGMPRQEALACNGRLW